MQRVISATWARAHFGEVVRLVVAGDSIVVERGGAPQVVILSDAEYERMSSAHAGTPTWQRLLARTHDLQRAECGEKRPEAADAAIQAMRAERDVALGELR